MTPGLSVGVPVLVVSGGLPSYGLILLITFLLLRSLPHLYDDDDDDTRTDAVEERKPSEESEALDNKRTVATKTPPADKVCTCTGCFVGVLYPYPCDLTRLTTTEFRLPIGWWTRCTGFTFAALEACLSFICHDHYQDQYACSNCQLCL